MMRSLTMLLVTGLLLGMGAPVVTAAVPNQTAFAESNMGRTPTTNKDNDEKVANAAIVTQGKFGTVNFYLTDQGDLHLGAGQFPEHEVTPGDSGRGQLLQAVARAYYNDPNLSLNELSKVTEKITRVIFDGDVVAAVDASHTFARLKRVTEYVGLTRLNTSRTTNMSYMFTENFYVTTMDVSQLDTRQATNMVGMFASNSRLQELDVSNFITDKVTAANVMLASTHALKVINLEKATFAATTSAAQMISDSGVEVLNLPVFDPLSNAGSVLYGSKSLRQLTLGPRAQQGKFYNVTDPPKNETYTGKWQIVGEGTVVNPLGEKFDTGSQIGRRDSTLVLTEPDTYVWEPVDRVLPPVTPPPVTPPPITPPVETSQPVTVQYLDERGQRLADDVTLTGELGATYQAATRSFSGYKLKRTVGQPTGTFKATAQRVVFHYVPDLVTGGDGDGIAPLATVVYATKKVGLYRTKNFSTPTRHHWYPKQKRHARPMFVVTGYATSKTGQLRYKVRDVNHQSKTAGKMGYLTANRHYTVPVYYATKQVKVRVINPKGVNGYRQKSLKGKQQHYRQGQRLRVKKIVKYRKTTRFVLTNGQYVTANKKLVISQ